MTIKLTQADVDLIKKALTAWEKDASSGAIVGEMLGAMLLPQPDREKDRLLSEQRLKKAEQEGDRRKDEATLLRAKLIQSSAKASEHEEVQHADH